MNSKLFVYKDRRHAGQVLVQEVKRLFEIQNQSDVILIALPRGGVPVAYEIAKELGIPLAVLLVRKIGAPFNPEFAMGALVSHAPLNGKEADIYLNQEAINAYEIPHNEIQNEIEKQSEVNRQRKDQYSRHDTSVLMSFSELKGKTLILVDDGMATGATMRIAFEFLKQFHPAQIAVAVPVGSSDSCDYFNRRGVKVICPLQPEFFDAVGAFYDDFSATSDDEVVSARPFVLY